MGGRGGVSGMGRGRGEMEKVVVADGEGRRGSGGEGVILHVLFNNGLHE